jgi:hypothetical protein
MIKVVESIPFWASPDELTGLMITQPIEFSHLAGHLRYINPRLMATFCASFDSLLHSSSVHYAQNLLSTPQEQSSKSRLISRFGLDLFSFHGASSPLAQFNSQAQALSHFTTSLLCLGYFSPLFTKLAVGSICWA